MTNSAKSRRSESVVAINGSANLQRLCMRYIFDSLSRIMRLGKTVTISFGLLLAQCVIFLLNVPGAKVPPNAGVVENG